MNIYFTFATFIRLENYSRKVFILSVFVKAEDKTAALTFEHFHSGFWFDL